MRNLLNQQFKHKPATWIDKGFMVSALWLLLLTVMKMWTVLSNLMHRTTKSTIPIIVDYCKEPLPFHAIVLGLIFLSLSLPEKQWGWFIALVGVMLTYDITIIALF